MPEISRATKRSKVLEHLRDPLMSPNSNATIARFHGVSSEFVAKLRKEVEAEGTAFQPGTRHLISIEDLRLDGGTQPRAQLDKKVSREYRDDVKAGAVFPPIGVVYDGSDYWVWDGFHRVDAFRMAGVESIPAEIRQGTRRDAVLLAAGANADHGWRRTNEDKHRAVVHLLMDSEWTCWSNEEIARKCCVHCTTVGNIRKELEAKGDITPRNSRAGTDGKIYTVPSTNGHAAPTDSHEDSTDESPRVTPATSQAPPMRPPVVVDHKVSVTLNGDPDVDYARLLESYPALSLAKLGKLIAGEVKQAASDDATSTPPGLTEGQAMILRRLRRGPATSEDLTLIMQSGMRRKWELEVRGYVIEKRGGAYVLVSEPSPSNVGE